jgi:hypothetical protein
MEGRLTVRQSYEFRTEISNMLHRKEKIQAVKSVKDFYGIGLMEAKDLVDSISTSQVYNNLCYDVDTTFDLYEAGCAFSSKPTSDRKTGDVEKLAETLAAMVWAKLEDKIDQAFTEPLAWDIQQLRNDLTLISNQLYDTDARVLEVRKDIAVTRQQIRMK